MENLWLKLNLKSKQNNNKNMDKKKAESILLAKWGTLPPLSIVQYPWESTVSIVTKPGVSPSFIP